MSFLSENLLSILTAIIVLSLYLKIKRLLSYFSDRGMPYIKPTIGDLFKSFTVEAFNDLPELVYNKCKRKEETSQYIGVFSVFMTPAIMVLDPKLVENILIKDFSSFQDHGGQVDLDVNPLDNHLFNMKGDQWRTLRHKLVPTFTSGKLRGMLPIIEQCADKLVQEIKQDSSFQNDTNLKELFKKYSLSVIASTAFGIDPDSIKDPNCQFRKIMGDVVNPSKSSQLVMALSFIYPKIVSLLRLKIFSQEAEDFMLSLTKQSFETRKNSGEKRNDFIQLLLELKEKGSVDLDAKDLEQDEKDNIDNLNSKISTEKLELTDKLLMAQVFVFLIGGFENTAYLVAITVYVLSKHPEIQARVREEVKECIDDNERNLNYQTLRNMKLLQSCIDEALRLYTPAPVLPRECNKAYTLSDGRKMDKGTTVWIPCKCFHMDSRYWPDPEEFKPERFLNGETIIPGTYLPFGDGPRICIAQRMAKIIAKMMLVKLLQKFELLPSPKTKEPIDIKVVFAADNDGGFWGTFKELED